MDLLSYRAIKMNSDYRQSIYDEQLVSFNEDGSMMFHWSMDLFVRTDGSVWWIDCRIPPRHKYKTD